MLALCGDAIAGSPTLVPQPGVTAPASIPELARALKYDVNLIYEYVYTNIEYSPTYGLKKGALGTLLDGSGNDFDQSALLVDLLRASGYTADYKHGTMRLGTAAINAFYGVDVSDACPLLRLLTSGGIPVTITVFGPLVCTSPMLYADIAHTWVTVTGGSLGATTYTLDPSYKAYIVASGINLATATGYDQATFLSSAKSGATITGSSIQNLNSTNIATALKGYAASLISYIRNNNPTATTRDIIGGKYIQPLIQPYTPPSTLPYQTPGSTPLTWTGNVPDQYRTTLQVQIGGINKTYFGDEIYGHRLSVVYNGSAQPVLYLDGIVQGTGTANANTLSYTVNFPFCFATSGASSPSCGTGYTDTLNFQNVLRATSGYTYAVIAGWDFTGRGMVEFHRRQLQMNQAAGAPDASESVLGEALNMIGYSWLAQLNAANALIDRLVGTKTVTHCAIGVAAQVNGPYVDLPGNFFGASSLTNDVNRTTTSFFTGGGMLSALEWGTLAQDLARLNVGAVSTIKLLDIANGQQDVIYDATSANWASVQPQLIGYAAGDLAEIQNYINAGYRLVLPRHGNLTEGAWTGAGYIGISPGGGATREITYKISSNLKGGYSAQPVPPGLTASEVAFIGMQMGVYPDRVSFDPIDLSSGAFLYDHDDLSIGSGDFPLRLTFSSSYNSNNLYAKGPMGAGWTHGFSINAAANSDGLRGMGQDSPIDGAAAIAALHVAQDLFGDVAKPFDKVLIASLVQKWLMDRLITNTVNVAMGSHGEQFVLLPDGSYNPQPGSSNRLSLDNGQYRLQQKDGTTLQFNADGDISSWTMPAGPSVSFVYDASSPPLLTTVSNNVGRSLILGYNDAKQLTAVADNAWPPRSVNYTYDAAGNLASFADPLGNTTTFAYTQGGGGAPKDLLMQIFYPSGPTPFATNVYDSLGRVAFQTNANGATWNYFFAGYRSEEVDPYGTRHVLYYNPRGKTLFDISDYDGLALLTKSAHDGLDRLISTILPSGLTTSYTYATSPNPWANNVATVTRSAPSGPLSPTVTTSSYEPSFNKEVSITDALGRVTTMTYDPWNGNLLSKTVDAGAAPHFNARTSFTYNAVGLLTSTTDPGGTVTRHVYDDFGNRTITVTDAVPGGLNLTTTSTYDLRGDPISVTDPRGSETTNSYDDARRLIATTAPGTPGLRGGITTANTYDALGRIVSVQQTANGNVLRTVSTTYTPTSKQATTTDANGNVTRFTYDQLDRLASVTDAAGRVATYGYDALSRPTGTFNPAIQATALLTQTWTANGKLATLADANGNTTSFGYDGFDRLVTTTYPGGSTETFSYDTVDNRLTRSTRAGDTITFTYDTLNRARTKTTASSGLVVTNAYDLTGRVTSVSDNSAAIAPAVPPGGSTVAYTTTYAYDALNRPTGASWDPAPAATSPPAGALVTFGHSYNAVNQRINQTVSDNTWLSYPTGAPSTTAYTANALNQYTAVTGLTPSYDANGNLAGDGTYSLAYDAENRLTSASGSGNSSTYAFDGQGRRKTRTINGTTTISVTDADNREVLEYNGSSGAILRWYAYGLGPNDVLNQMNVAAGTRTVLVPDLLGSIIATFDSTGTLVKSSYQPYGNSAAAANPFGYTGQRIDPETGGLYYYRARHYSPVLGRFLQTDPTGYKEGPNLYAYVSNNPLNSRDPLGLASLQLAQYGNTIPYPTPAPTERMMGTVSGAVAGGALFGTLLGAGAALLPMAIPPVALGITIGVVGGMIAGGIWGYNGGWERWLGY